MGYADFVASTAYRAKVAGAAIGIKLIDESDPTVEIVGATTGANSTDDFETIVVEEAGQDGADEIVQGRHSGTGTIPAFWTPEWNDKLPSRQSFIGRTFVILEFVARGEHTGTVVNAFTGCVISRVGQAQGARGAKTFDVAFTYQRRYNGQEWADETGNS